MEIIVAWLRIDLRRRWRSLAVLALLIAIATGTVLTAVAGARRGDTAAQRLWDQTLPATATVLPNDPTFDWDKVRALPEVEALSGFAVAPFFVDELPDYFGYVPPVDGAAMHTLERPVVLAGRLADPARPDEMVVTAQFPVSYGKQVGDTLTLHLMSAAQGGDPDFLTGKSAPAGPRITARIVGVIRSPWFSDEPGSTGGIVPSAALYGRYPTNFLGTRKFGVVNAVIRLRGGEADLPMFRAHLTQVAGRADIEVWNNADFRREAQRVDRFESACLLAFGLAALAAAIVLVGQSVSRYVTASGSELRVLQALGLRRLQGVGAAAAGPALAGLAGTTLGVVAAVIASRWMPIGVAAMFEPAPGTAVDPIVLGCGWLAGLVLVAGGAAGAAWLALSTRQGITRRRSAVATAAARAGLPVPVLVGARFALEPGYGRSAVPVRPALLGAVTGVLGVLAAMTFSAGVSDAATTPERFGQTFQLIAHVGESGHDWTSAQRALAAIAHDPDVVAVNDTRVAVAQSRNTSITLSEHHPAGTRALPVVLVSGAMPAAADQVVLAPTTAGELHVSVGSTVRLRGTRSRAATVSGIGFVPQGSHNEYDEGGWLSPAGFDRLFDGFKFHSALIAVRPGADVRGVHARLQEAVAKAGGGDSQAVLEDAIAPSQVAEIQDVRLLPLVLGVFLAVLAVGAVGHALATAVRRRRTEIAVLRALGMTRWQSRGVVATQASLLAFVGVAFGAPIGLALGRLLWRLVADYTPLQYVPPVAVWALLLVGPLALVLANLLAAWPGHRAAGLRIGNVLRAE